jgi:hypothetical protein
MSIVTHDGKVSEFDPSTVEGFGGQTKSSSGNSSMVSIGKSIDGSFTSNYGTSKFLLEKAGI